MASDRHIRELITRLARLDAAAGWEGDLNPTQRAVLYYLGRANRFSRGPSQVAEYLGSTRGTVSQSVKSLGQKGYIAERRSTVDKRAIRLDLTEKGIAEFKAGNRMLDGLHGLGSGQKDQLASALTALLSRIVVQNSGKHFGVCKRCRHFAKRPEGGFCNLLSEDLTAQDIQEICHEQEPT